MGTVPHSEHMHSYPVSVLPCLSYLLVFNDLEINTTPAVLSKAFFNEDLPEIQLDIFFGDKVFDILLSPQEISEFSSLRA